MNRLKTIANRNIEKLLSICPEAAWCHKAKKLLQPGYYSLCIISWAIVAQYRFPSLPRVRSTFLERGLLSRAVVLNQAEDDLSLSIKAQLFKWKSVQFEWNLV